MRKLSLSFIDFVVVVLTVVRIAVEQVISMLTVSILQDGAGCEGVLFGSSDREIGRLLQLLLVVVVVLSLRIRDGSSIVSTTGVSGVRK